MDKLTYSWPSIKQVMEDEAVSIAYQLDSEAKIFDDIGADVLAEKCRHLSKAFLVIDEIKK